MTPDARIASLDLTRRLTLALERRGITTVGALCAMLRAEVAAINGIGPGCLAEMQSALAQRGLSLAGERYRPPPTRKVTLTLTSEVAEHAARTGDISAALEDAYRAQHRLVPPPAPSLKGKAPRR